MIDNYSTQALGQLPLAETKERLLLNAKGDSWVDSFPLKKELRPSKEQFETRWSLHPEEMDEVKIMGKPVKTPPGGNNPTDVPINSLAWNTRHCPYQTECNPSWTGPTHWPTVRSTSIWHW